MPLKVIDILNQFHHQADRTMITDIKSSRIININNSIIGPDDFGSVKNLESNIYQVKDDILYIVVNNLDLIKY